MNRKVSTAVHMLQHYKYRNNRDTGLVDRWLHTDVSKSLSGVVHVFNSVPGVLLNGHQAL